MISLTSPVKTAAHDWPAGLKLASLCGATLALFFIENVYSHLIVFAITLGLYRLPGVAFFQSGLQQLRILWPFIFVVAAWHIWIDDISEGVTVILRLMSAVALANLVTMTTRLSDMIDVVRVLTRPAVRFGLQSNILEMSIALVIRLTPVLVQKGSQLSEAWSARSRRKARWRIILPFTVLALDDAEQVAEALRARGGLNIQEEI